MRLLQSDKKSCDNCGNYDSSQCLVPDGVGWCHKETWRSWVPKMVEDDGNPFNRQVSGNHYKNPDVMDIAEFLIRHKVEMAESNVMKYAFRHEKKNGIEDLRKAQHYLQFIAWVKYKEVL